MDKSDIKKAIRNMNVWLDECHNDGDTVVMTANVLRSIRDNYCELLRCRDAIERLSDRNQKCIYLSDEETSEHCVDSICPQFKTEGQIKSEARKEVVDVVRKELLAGFGEVVTADMLDRINTILAGMEGDENV